MHKIKVVCILSPEDPHVDELFHTCLVYDFDTIYHTNTPVAAKLNAGISHCMKHYQFDYLMNFGSDDLIHPDIFRLYNDLIKIRKPFFGINNLYFLQFPSGRAVHYFQYNSRKSIGAGRMIHRDVISSMLKRNQPLYDMEISRGMDSSSERRISCLAKVRDHTVDAGKFPYVVDIKTEDNINCFCSIVTDTRHITYVDPFYVQKHYPHVLSPSNIPL
jgi:hypothetical protein